MIGWPLRGAVETPLQLTYSAIIPHTVRRVVSVCQGSQSGGTKETVRSPSLSCLPTSSSRVSSNSSIPVSTLGHNGDTQSWAIVVRASLYNIQFFCHKGQAQHALALAQRYPGQRSLSIHALWRDAGACEGKCSQAKHDCGRAFLLRGKRVTRLLHTCGRPARLRKLRSRHSRSTSRHSIRSSGSVEAAASFFCAWIFFCLRSAHGQRDSRRASA